MLVNVVEPASELVLEFLYLLSSGLMVLLVLYDVVSLFEERGLVGWW